MNVDFIIPLKVFPIKIKNYKNFSHEYTNKEFFSAQLKFIIRALVPGLGRLGFLKKRE